MAWPTNRQGLANNWNTDLQPIIDLFTGVSGGGDQVQITQYNSSSNYAVTIRNLDTTNGRALKVTDASDNILLQLYKNNLQLGASAANDSLAINCNISGKVYIGDSANANMTTGLTINQGAADNEIVALKSSDVVHGMTTDAETDTYGYLAKAAAATGGAYLRGFSSGTLGLALRGEHVTDDTTKAGNSSGAILLAGGLKSGTTVGALGADANILVVRNHTTTRFILDAEGTLHSIGASYTDSIGNGLWFINDTANANMTVGLTINQGAAVDEALALKNSTAAHGITDKTETDTFLRIIPLNDLGGGGAAIQGFANADTAEKSGLDLQGFMGSAADTTKTTAARGVVEVDTHIKSGTGVTAVGADGNCFVVMNNGIARFIFDAEGSFHADVGSTTFDDYDDVVLLEALDAELNRRQGRAVDAQFGEWLREHKAILQRERIVNFYDDGPRVMLNMTRLAKLHTGAIRQLARRLELAEQRLAALPAA